MSTATLAEALDAALEAYAELTELGETIDDEWSYVQDLTEAWRSRFDEVRSGRGDEPVDPPSLAALEAVAGEARRIEDPHRAIDWLSTYPQVVLWAVGEMP
jgi:hypothetical protein